MRFQLTDDQKALRDGVRGLLARRFGPARLRAAAAAPGVLDRVLWRELGAAGFFALRLPEAEGGVGLGLPEAVLVFEEAGRALLPGPLVATHLAAGAVAGAAEGETVVAAVDGGVVEWLAQADVVHGRAAGAVPMRSLDPLTPLHRVPAAEGAGGGRPGPEGCGQRPGLRERFGEAGERSGRAGEGLGQRPGRTGAAGVRSGERPGRTGAAGERPERPGAAGERFGPVGEEPGQAGLVAGEAGNALEADESGVRPGGAGAARVRPGAAARGTGGLGPVAVLLSAAEQLGTAARVCELAVQHARAREQFGRPIGAFQAVQHLCADMLVRTETARAAVYAAAVTGDPVDIAAARLLADEAAVRGARDCLQVHGGMGFTWESEVHLHLKRTWVRAHRGGGVTQSEELLAGDLVAGTG
ncbi:acyl-CoA dehydrogenase family protein [Streptomyces sp. NPDC020801]|uniref:acyl-CoA dehydrogenase family protein n=1 Tax=Streptomyces sp. NPDC020801 TaxID=3365093 RepID=UPI0037877025